MPSSDIIITARGVEVACGEKLPRLEILAYCGGVMKVPGWGPLAIDLAGLDLSGQVRVLADHDSSIEGILGHGKAEARDGKLFVSGAISSTTDAAKSVVELAKNGFEFQASVGVEPIEHAKVKAGEKADVNGRTLSAPEGGFTLVKRGKLREVSIVSMGCDDRTAVAIAASKGGGMNIDEEKIRAEERERLAKIEAFCSGDWGRDKERVEALKAKAIAGELTVEELTPKLLAIMRAARPQAGCVNTILRDPEPHAIEAALLMRLGHEELAEKTLGERACEYGRRLGAAHMLDFCRACLEEDGAEVPRGRLEVVKAAMSTCSLPAALGNVANKLLLSAYEESPATWRAFSAVRSVADFKENTAIRPSFTGQLEPVAPGGELKHGSVGEHVSTFKCDTYGKLLSIDRRDLVNDDLSMFEDAARAMGKAAMRKVSDLVYETLLANAGGFFSAANGNLIDGVSSALSLDSLSLAIQAMRTQRDGEGNDLDIVPVTLLVPPELSVQAKAVLESEFIQRAAEQPTGNSLRRAVALEVEPRLSNTAKFDGKASGKHWYLFAAPSAGPMIVAFLNGVQRPTVEYFGLEQTVDKLAVSWRVYLDFGAALCDPRAAVRSAGE